MDEKAQPAAAKDSRQTPAAPQVGSIGPVPLDNTDKFQDENCAEHQEINGDQGNADFQPHGDSPRWAGSPCDSG